MTRGLRQDRVGDGSSRGLRCAAGSAELRPDGLRAGSALDRAIVVVGSGVGSDGGNDGRRRPARSVVQVADRRSAAGSTAAGPWLSTANTCWSVSASTSPTRTGVPSAEVDPREHRAVDGAPHDVVVVAVAPDDVVVVVGAPHDVVVVGVAPDDVVVVAVVPQTMLSPSSALPQTMLSPSLRCPRRCCRRRRSRAPDDVVARRRSRCPTRCCRRRRCPRRCCRRRRCAPDDVVVVAAVPQTMLSSSCGAPDDVVAVVDVPQTMLSPSPRVVPHTMLSPSSVLATPQMVLGAPGVRVGHQHAAASAGGCPR